MKRVHIIAGAVLAATCLSATASATAAPSAKPKAKPGQIVVMAMGKAHGTLTIKHAADVTLKPIVQNAALALPSGTVTTDSPYLGIQISQGRHVVFGIYQDHALSDVEIFGNHPAKLPAGKYDVTVLTTKPALIRIPISGSGSYPLLLTQPAAGTRTEVAAAALSPSQPIDVASTTAAMTAGSTALLMLTSSATSESAVNANLCLTPRHLPCELGSAVGTNPQSTSLGATGQSRNQSSLYVYPGAVAPGNYYAYADQEVVGVQQAATFVVVTIGS